MFLREQKFRLFWTVDVLQADMTGKKLREESKSRRENFAV